MDTYVLANDVNQYCDENVKNLKEESIAVFYFSQKEIELISRNRIYKEMGYVNCFPTVCDAMKTLGLFRMEVIQSPPKVLGAKMRIR